MHLIFVPMGVCMSNRASMRLAPVEGTTRCGIILRKQGFSRLQWLGVNSVSLESFAGGILEKKKRMQQWKVQLKRRSHTYKWKRKLFCSSASEKSLAAKVRFLLVTINRWMSPHHRRFCSRTHSDWLWSKASLLLHHLRLKRSTKHLSHSDSTILVSHLLKQRNTSYLDAWTLILSSTLDSWTLQTGTHLMWEAVKVVYKIFPSVV